MAVLLPTPMTELEAVNLCLSAIGESPVASVDTASPDVEMAVNLLRATSRAVQTKRWRFNTVNNVKIAPSGTTVIDGVTYRTFTVPNGLTSFRLSSRSDQYGMDAVDEGGSFYDRANARAGFPLDYLYIDKTVEVAFESLPAAARTYITIVAARQLYQQLLGGSGTPGFNESDEYAALKTLMDQQGHPDQYNIFTNPSVYSVLGGRRRRA